MPDSRHLLFSAHTQNTHELYIADTESGRYHTVLTQDRPARFPGVSPDGSRVAYQSSLSHADVIAVPLAGGPVRTLLGSSRSEEMANCSPVARQVVYVTDRRGRAEVWITSLAEHWDRPLLSPADVRGHTRPVQFFMTPVFSPDGQRVAVAVGPRAAIYTIFASGGSPVRVTGETGSEYAPTWSPDGNWLAFLHQVGNELRLVRVRVGSGQSPVDLGVTKADFVPAWSPTGEWIAFHDQDNNLSLVSPDGRKRRKLSSFGPVAWARDGRTLYQIGIRSHLLVAIDVGTGKTQTLRDLGDLTPFANPWPALCASLTPDGESIVYTVNRSREEIWILDGLQAPQPWYRRLWPR